MGFRLSLSLSAAILLGVHFWAWAAQTPLDLQDVDKWQELEKQRVQETYDLERFIPFEALSEEDSPEKVSKKILGRTVQTLLEDSPLAQSPVVRSVEELNRSLSGELRFAPGEDGRSHRWLGPIEHRLSFRVRADQGRALIRYRGYTEAEMSYNFLGHALRFEINEQLTSRLELLLIHEFSHEEILHEVNMRWSW